MLGASSDTVTGYFNILGLFRLATKLQYIGFSMKGTAALVLGKAASLRSWKSWDC